jgi:hypothetical protein
MKAILLHVFIGHVLTVLMSLLLALVGPVGFEGGFNNLTTNDVNFQKLLY